MFAYMPSSLVVESLVMSKLDYRWVILYPLPDYQMKWLQRVQTTCTGLYLSGRILFLRTSKNWTGYPLLKGETWHCWNPFLKPLLLGLITYALNFILSLPISTKVGYSNWKRHFSGLGSEIVFNSLPDKLRQETDYRKFVWWPKPCSPKEKVYNWFFLIFNPALTKNFDREVYFQYTQSIRYQQLLMISILPVYP